MVPFVIFNLDKPIELKFNAKAIASVQELTGIKFTELAAKLDGEAPVDLLYTILWSMLRKNDPSLSVDDVYDLIDNHFDSTQEAIEAVTDAVNRAINAGFPVGDGKNAKRPKTKIS